MRVNPTGRSEYHNGNEVLRYGHDISAREQYAVWYHSGIRSFDEPTWAMDPEVEGKIHIQVKTILVADDENGLYAIDRKGIGGRTIVLDGRDQHLVRSSDPFVRKITDDPDNVLQDHLWIESSTAHGGYHKDKNEA
jgi:hypothetical protein